ncbi:hypothetical protein D3C72_2392680 [compost metagenome]
MRFLIMGSFCCRSISDMATSSALSMPSGTAGTEPPLPLGLRRVKGDMVPTANSLSSSSKARLRTCSMISGSARRAELTRT